ncbi:unnamed protein product, partial [Closterium sp. Yama58-4]
TSAAAAGGVTAETSASAGQPNGDLEPQHHRRLLWRAIDDGTSTSCRLVLLRKTKICNSQGNTAAVRKCLDSLAPLRRTCLRPTTL